MTSDETDPLIVALGVLGQNGGMPASLANPPEMPEDAARALRAFSATSRAVVARYLLLHPGSTSTEVTAATGVTAIHPVLKELMRLGFVQTNVEGNRNGRRDVRYTVDRASLRESLAAFAAWVLAEDHD